MGRLEPLGTGMPPEALTSLQAFAAHGRPIRVHVGQRTLVLERAGRPAAEIAWERRGTDGASLRLAAEAGEGGPEACDAVAAACVGLFERQDGLAAVTLDLVAGSPLATALARTGIALHEEGRLTVRPEMLWQQPGPWLPDGHGGAYPQRYVVGTGLRHPVRPPKPEGCVYARFIPWLGKTLSFHAAAPETHLEPFNRWMNDPRVAAIWEEEGDLVQHRAYIERQRADPHVLPLVGCFDGAPFGYFEVYWAKENRLGSHYAADDYDRGWHVLVGEDAFRGKAWLTAWLPSLMHFMFLDDPRTRRIVGEPKASHAQQIRNLDRSGFAKVKHVDFPHKRALLVMLERERFFGDRLWRPAPDTAAGAGA